MIDALDVIPAPGRGVLAHHAGIVVFVDPPPESPEAARPLLDLAAEAAAGPFAGEPFVKGLARLLAAEGSVIPPFVAVADVPGGALVLVRGDLEVAAISGGAEIVVSGATSLTWVDQVVAGELTVVRAGPRFHLPDDAALRREPPLAHGVVPAGGFVLLSTSPDPPRGALDLGSPEEFKSVLLTESVAPVGRSPLPLASEVISVLAEPATGKIVVHGYVCARGHFNDPSNFYCAVCGISMAQRTQIGVEGERPALGFLVFDDGSIYTLDGDYVVGREAQHDDRVRDGARPLLVDDAAHTVSRVHAEIRLEGWQVRLVDRESTNGTFVATDAASRWRRLDPGQSEEVAPGTRIAFGHRTCRFESPHGHRHP